MKKYFIILSFIISSLINFNTLADNLNNKIYNLTENKIGKKNLFLIKNDAKDLFKNAPESAIIKMPISDNVYETFNIVKKNNFENYFFAFTSDGITSNANEIQGVHYVVNSNQGEYLGHLNLHEKKFTFEIDYLNRHINIETPISMLNKNENVFKLTSSKIGNNENFKNIADLTSKIELSNINKINNSNKVNKNNKVDKPNKLPIFKKTLDSLINIQKEIEVKKQYNLPSVFNEKTNTMEITSGGPGDDIDSTLRIEATPLCQRLVINVEISYDHWVKLQNRQLYGQVVDEKFFTEYDTSAIIGWNQPYPIPDSVKEEYKLYKNIYLNQRRYVLDKIIRYLNTTIEVFSNEAITVTIGYIHLNTTDYLKTPVTFYLKNMVTGDTLANKKRFFTKVEYGADRFLENGFDWFGLWDDDQIVYTQYSAQKRMFNQYSDRYIVYNKETKKQYFCTPSMSGRFQYGGIPLSRNFSSKKDDEETFGIESAIYKRWSNIDNYRTTYSAYYRDGATDENDIYNYQFRKNNSPDAVIYPLYVQDTTFDNINVDSIIQIDTLPFISLPGLHIYIGKEIALNDNFSPSSTDRSDKSPFSPTNEEERFRAYTSNEYNRDKLGSIDEDLDFVMEDNMTRSFNSENFLPAYSNMRNNPSNNFYLTGTMDVGCHMKDIGVVTPFLSNAFSTYDHNWESSIADYSHNQLVGDYNCEVQQFVSGSHNTAMAFLPLFFDDAYYKGKRDYTPIGNTGWNDYSYFRGDEFNDEYVDDNSIGSTWNLKDHDELYGEKFEYGSTDYPAFDTEKWNKWMFVYCVAQSLGARYFTTFNNPNTILSPLARNLNYTESNYDFFNGTPRISAVSEVDRYNDDYGTWMEWYWDNLWNVQLAEAPTVFDFFDVNGDGEFDNKDLARIGPSLAISAIITYLRSKEQLMQAGKLGGQGGKTLSPPGQQPSAGFYPGQGASRPASAFSCGEQIKILKNMDFGSTIILGFVLTPVSNLITDFISKGFESNWSIDNFCTNYRPPYPSVYATAFNKDCNNGDCIRYDYSGAIDEYDTRYNYINLKLAPGLLSSVDLVSFNKGFDQLTGDLMRLNLTGYHVSGRIPWVRAIQTGNNFLTCKLDRFQSPYFYDWQIEPPIINWINSSGDEFSKDNRYQLYGFSNPHAKIKTPRISYVWGDTIRLEADNLQRRKVWPNQANCNQASARSMYNTFKDITNLTPTYRTYADTNMQFNWTWVNSIGSTSQIPNTLRRPILNNITGQGFYKPFGPASNEPTWPREDSLIHRSFAKLAAPQFTQNVYNPNTGQMELDSLFAIYPLRLQLTNTKGCKSNSATKWVKVYPRKLTPIVENFNKWFGVSGRKGLKSWDFISPWSAGDGIKETQIWPTVAGQRGYYLRSSMAADKNMASGTGWGSHEYFGSTNGRNWSSLVYQPITQITMDLNTPTIYDANAHELIVPLALSEQYEFPRGFKTATFTQGVDNPNNKLGSDLNKRGASPFKNWYSKRGFYNNLREYFRVGYPSQRPQDPTWTVPQPSYWPGRNYRTHCFYDYWRHGMDDTARSPVYVNDNSENQNLTLEFDVSNFFPKEAKVPLRFWIAKANPSIYAYSYLDEISLDTSQHAKRFADTLKVYGYFGSNPNPVLLYKKGGKDLNTTTRLYNPTTDFDNTRTDFGIGLYSTIGRFNYKEPLPTFFRKLTVTHTPKKTFDPNEWRHEVINLDVYDTCQKMQFDFIYKNKHTRFVKNDGDIYSDADIPVTIPSLSPSELSNVDMGAYFQVDQKNDQIWDNFMGVKYNFFQDYEKQSPVVDDETFSAHSPLYLTNMKVSSRLKKILCPNEEGEFITGTRIQWDSTITRCDRKGVYTLTIPAGHNAKKYQILLQTRPLTQGSTNVWTNQVVIKEGNINNTWNSNTSQYEPNSQVIIKDSIQNMFGTITGLLTGYEYAIRAKVINTSNHVHLIPADTFRTNPSVTRLTCEPFQMERNVLLIDSIKDTDKNYKLTANFPSGHNVSTFQLFERKDPSTTWIPISGVLTIPNNNYYEYPFPNIVGKPDGNYFYYMELKNPSINCVPNSTKSNTRSVFACFGCKIVKKPTINEDPIGSLPDANGNFALKISLERNHNLKRLELYESRIATLNPYNPSQLGGKISTYTLSNNLEFSVIRNFANKSTGFYYYTVKGIDAQNNQSNIVYSDFFRIYVPETPATACKALGVTAYSIQPLNNAKPKNYLQFYLNKNCTNNKYRVIMYKLNSNLGYSASDENLSLDKVSLLTKTASLEKFNPLFGEIPTSTISFTPNELIPTMYLPYTGSSLIETAGFFSREITPKLTTLNSWYRIDVICTSCNTNNVETFYKYFRSNILEN
jgi:hypothetical protein